MMLSYNKLKYKSIGIYSNILLEIYYILNNETK